MTFHREHPHQTFEEKEKKDNLSNTTNSKGYKARKLDYLRENNARRKRKHKNSAPPTAMSTYTKTQASISRSRNQTLIKFFSKILFPFLEITARFERAAANNVQVDLPVCAPNDPGIINHNMSVA